MKLRLKILIVIAAMMGIEYVIVAGALLPELAASRLRARRQLGLSVARTLAAALEALPVSARRERLVRADGLFGAPPALQEWAILDGQEHVVAWSRREPPPERLESEDARRLDLDAHLPACDESGVPWRLRASVAVDEFTAGRELWSLFVAMLAGTVLLGGAVYILVARLAIEPVERLASASRAAAHARGPLPKVPHSERTDEAGELFRAYNAMVDEVNDLRLNLERRVESAVKDLEQAQKQILLSERLSMTGKLAAGVAHEINNPLAGMLNAARSLRQKAPGGSREAEYLELIVEGLGRVQGIVSTMLHFARSSAPRTTVDLPEVLDQAVLFCRYRLTWAGVELVREFPAPGAPAGRVEASRAELGQAFLNLLVNALDAMEQTTGAERRLTLAVRVEDGRAVAAVADSGPGMTAETHARAGELFFSTKPEGRGTGLGLAIARHIVQEHGGTLNVESAPGRGTRVVASFPLAAR